MAKRGLTINIDTEELTAQLRAWQLALENKHLVLAAPKMLDLLKELRSDIGLPTGSLSFLDKLDAVIAKAEGA